MNYDETVLGTGNSNHPANEKWEPATDEPKKGEFEFEQRVLITLDFYMNANSAQEVAERCAIIEKMINAKVDCSQASVVSAVLVDVQGRPEVEF